MRITNTRRLSLPCGVLSVVMLTGWPQASFGQKGDDSKPRSAVDSGKVVWLDAPRVESVEPSKSRATILRLDLGAFRQARGQGTKLRVQGFPLSTEQSVDLELEPFSVVSPDTRFVIGRLDGPDRPFAYDTSRIKFFRGRVVGHPGSHVYLSLSDRSSTGYIDIGPDTPRHRISSKGGDGRELDAGFVSVFEATAAPSAPDGIPLCGVEGDKLRMGDSWVNSPFIAGDSGKSAAVTTSTVGLRHLELAVETDYELFTLFDDATATADYVVQMYGEVSAIFMRDVDTRIEVVFARIWDNPNDLFNGPQPLFEFYPWWSQNMNAITRDSVQFFSGRRDFPFGGQAFISALCDSSFGYGMVGYAVGSFPDPSVPHPFNWDVPVTAHELGHSCGTGHTHSNGIDTCDDPNTTPQRGPIMSYCGQTWSGMKANTDNYFHTVSRGFMESHISASACIVADCNMNNVADSIDIAGPTSDDTNFNGVPDECEDCNNNSVLDPLDILGASTDFNGNGIPDECEPDCNSNNIPDDRDILLGTSLDKYGNGIPDGCETDCNSNGTSDYTEIQGDITLDKDRNAFLDSCQDCDTDGTSDLVELNSAHHLWVATGLSGQGLRQFYRSTGVLTASSTGATVNEGQDLIVTPAGDILVTSALNDRVMRFNSSGSYVDDFVSAGAGGLDYPTGIILSPSGRLLVSSRNTNSVLAYDGGTGATQGAFVVSGSGGLLRPFGLAYGPNGNLFVTSDADEVIEYDGTTGALVGVFVAAAGNGGLDQPRGLAFKPDGNLLVASYGTDEVLEYEGADAAPRGKWAQVGTETNITQDSPWGIRVGPNGHVFVTRTGTDFSSTPSEQDDVGFSHLTDARMFEFDVCTGDFRKTEIGGNDHGLNFASGFDFVPGWDIDCNLNEIPDQCDIDSGTSQDANTDGVPDECEIDCNSNGTYDRLDIFPFGASLDCNCNFVPDECDIASATSDDCNANGRPDECELDFDCNNNGTQDICEIFAGTALDCNGNNLIDTCEVGVDGIVLAEDFEGGLPSDWTATGIFSVTGSCSAPAPCDGVSWAYSGSTASCTYGDGQAGALVSPQVDLPPGTAELRYCTLYNTEADFDFADVVVNNVRVERISGAIGAWQNRTVDLTPFAGQTIQVIFRHQSDPTVSGTLGWLVDNVQIVSTTVTESCECVPSDPPETVKPKSPTNRYLLIKAGDPGQIQAIRVTFVSLPTPFHIWNDMVFWAGWPREVCENSGKGLETDPADCPPSLPTDTFWAAPLVCEKAGAHYMDWHGHCDFGICFGGLEPGKACLVDDDCRIKVALYNEGIVPSTMATPTGPISDPATYDIQVIAGQCSNDDESAYSAPLTLIQSGWGDVCGPGPGGACSAQADGIVDVANDVLGVLNKFANLSFLQKVRADLEPGDDGANNGPDFKVNVANDVLFCLAAFGGAPYPFVPGDPCNPG